MCAGQTRERATGTLPSPLNAPVTPENAWLAAIIGGRR